MKNLILITILTLSTTFLYAGSTNQATTGDWSTKSTWSLNHVPVAGETVMIPSGKTVTITDLENYTGNLVIGIQGYLILDGGSLYLGSASIINIYSLAKIQGMGNNTELIKIGGVQKYSGNSQTAVWGPVMASSSTGAGFVSFVPLPVKFISFTVNFSSTNNVLVKWSTAEEINADKYEIERSIDGSNWNTIAYVMASGSTNNVNNYSYTDKNINANVIYYRIKQVDNGGSFTYTIIETLKTAVTNSGIEVKIASADHKVILQFSQEVKSNVVVRFISFGGQVISQQTVNQPMGQVVLNADASLRGNYIVSVSNNQDLNTARQIIL